MEWDLATYYWGQVGVCGRWGGFTRLSEWLLFWSIRELGPGKPFHLKVLFEGAERANRRRDLVGLCRLTRSLLVERAGLPSVTDRGLPPRQDCVIIYRGPVVW